MINRMNGHNGTNGANTATKAKPATTKAKAKATKEKGKSGRARARETAIKMTMHGSLITTTILAKKAKIGKGEAGIVLRALVKTKELRVVDPDSRPREYAKAKVRAVKATVKKRGKPGPKPKVKPEPVAAFGRTSEDIVKGMLLDMRELMRTELRTMLRDELLSVLKGD